MLLLLPLQDHTLTWKPTQVGRARITTGQRQISTWAHEGALGDSASYYVQGGASHVAPDGASGDTVPSGKAGLGVGITEALGAYGEVSFQGSGSDSVDRGYGGKLGVKYSF